MERRDGKTDVVLIKCSLRPCCYSVCGHRRTHIMTLPNTGNSAKGGRHTLSRCYRAYI